MTGRSQGLLYLCLLIAVPTAVFILDLRYARSLGSGVSPSADPFSEANAVRAGINYQQDGFLRNAGLPNQGGTRYAIGVGFCFVVTAEQARAELVRAGGGEWETRPIAEVIEEYQKLAGEATVVIAESGSIECPDLVYTHYPPGPDYMVGLFLGLFPLDRLWLLRALPLTLTYVGEVWLLWELRKRFGGPLAAIAVGLVSICGAIRLFSHGLHNQGYASALLLVQIAAVLMGVRYWEARTARRLAVGGIATLAFLQGWLSFDFFFPVVREELEQRDRCRFVTGAVRCVQPCARPAFCSGRHLLRLDNGCGRRPARERGRAQFRARRRLRWSPPVARGPCPGLPADLRVPAE